MGIRYLYDSVSNNFFEVDDDCYRLLSDTEGETEELRCIGSEFWNSIYGEALPSLQDMSVETDSLENPEILVLELTQQCNFRCEYCVYSGHYKYERKHKNVKMTYEMVDQIIDTYFKSDMSPQYVSLYGGEPLLQFPLIQYLVRKIEKTGKKPEYAMTTNGSLINKEIAKFLVEKKVHLTVSFDGLNHDLYRKTGKNEATSETVLNVLRIINSISESYFEEYVSLSVTLAPPYKLCANADFFNSHELLSRVKLLINLVNDRDTDLFCDTKYCNERKELAYDYKKLADEFIEMDFVGKPFHRALFMSAMLRIDERKMELQEESFPPGPCSPGKNRLFITSEGCKYMCERVGDYGCLGHLNDKSKQNDKYNSVLRDFKAIVDNHCKKCLYVRLCDACYSLFREGNKMSNSERIKKICSEKRAWLDFMIYVYLSKKEKVVFWNKIKAL